MPTETGFEVSISLEDPTDPSRLVDGHLFVRDKELVRQRSIRFENEHEEKLALMAEESLTSPTRRQYVIGFGELGLMGPDRPFIHSSRLLDSAQVRARFPDHRIFLVSGSDPLMEPFFVNQPLVMPVREQNTSSSFLVLLRNAPTVAAFMNEYKQPVGTREEAGDVFRLLAELQGWNLVREMPENVENFRKDPEEEWVARWTYREVEEEDSWLFEGVFLHDPVIQSYHYAKIRVLRDGTLQVVDQKRMGSFGAYR